MKKLIALILALLFAVALAAATAHVVAFDAPVDASHYAAQAGTVASILPLSYDYQTGQLRFQLLDASGAVVANGAVFGLTVAAGDDASVKAAVLAAIQAAK